MHVALRTLGSIALVVVLVASALVASGVSPHVGGGSKNSSVRPATTYTGVTGHVYANTNNYAATAPLSGATVTIYDSCSSLESMSCTFVAATTTGSSGFFGVNLTAGSGYYAVVSRDSASAPAAPGGFGGAVQGFTAPDSTPLSIDVYPYVPYGNATIVLPAYNCMASYVDNSGGSGPGCQNPVLSWSQDGAFYVNATDVLVFYSFANSSVDPICNWTPLYQFFPSYAMIPNELFITQDGSYIYSWGNLSGLSNVLTVEAVNVTTHRVFLYNYTSIHTSDVQSNGAVLLTGWDGNDSQAVLIASNGQMYDHDLWSNDEALVSFTLPFFEGNNIYWEPDLNGFVNVEATGSSGDEVEELQLSGPVASSSSYSLSQTYIGQWTTAGIVVNGVNGVSFNVTSRELSVQAENSGLVYKVSPIGTITSLLLVTNLNPDGACNCVSIGPASESDRPALFASGPELSDSYNGFVNDSWLLSMAPGHVGYYSTNVSPYAYNPHASLGTVYTWSAWNQEGQFVNMSYTISQESYVCGTVEAAPCTINGGGGAAVGTIWWFWKLGSPEFPYPVTNPIADDSNPAATDVTSVSVSSTNATVHWTHPGTDALVNFTVAWGAQGGAPTGFASVPASESSFTITGLSPGVKYIVSVEAWNLHFHGENTGVSSFATIPMATSLVVTGTGVANVSLAWTNPVAGSFTNDSVEYGTSAGALTTNVSAGDVSAYTVTGLRPSTRYYFAVLVWNVTTPGLPSNTVSAWTSFVGATDLAVAAFGATNVSLAWSNPAAGTFSNITVEYGTSPGTLSTHLSAGTVSAYLVTGLTETTKYYFQVVAWNGTVEGTSSNVVNATTTFVGVIDLIVAGVTSSSAYLTWTDPPAGTFTNLTIEYGTSSTSLPGHLSIGTLVSSYTVTGLAPSTTYYFEVVAWDVSIPALPSNLAAGTTLFQGATDLIVSGKSTTSVSLVWTGPPPGVFTNLTVEYGTEPGMLTQHVSVGTADSYSVTGLNSSTAYYFEIAAWNGSVEGSPSNVVSAVTLFLGATNLEVTGTTTTNVSLNWTDPAVGAFSNLTVEYGTAADELTNRLSVGTVSSYTVTELASSVTYYFAVVAWNGSVEGSSSSIVSATTLFVGATDLAVTGTGTTNVSLAWTNPPSGGFTNLVVEYGATPIVLSVHLSVGTVSSYTVHSLSPATTYYFEIAAWNGSLEGLPSNVVSATTLSLGATGLVATGKTATNVSVSWTNPPVGTFTNLTVEYGVAPYSLGNHLSVGRVSTYTVTGLTPSTAYYFEVVAWNGSLAGPPSNLVSVVTLNPPPPPHSGSSGGGLSAVEFDAIVFAVVAAGAAVLGVLWVRSRRRKPPRDRLTSPGPSGGSPPS